MKEFVLILLFGANSTANGPAMIDGFKNRASCEVAAESILNTFDGSFTANAAVKLEARFECVEIVKE